MTIETQELAMLHPAQSTPVGLLMPLLTEWHMFRLALGSLNAMQARLSEANLSMPGLADNALCRPAPCHVIELSH